MKLNIAVACCAIYWLMMFYASYNGSIMLIDNRYELHFYPWLGGQFELIDKTKGF